MNHFSGATADLMPTDKSWEPFIDREWSFPFRISRLKPVQDGPLQGPEGMAYLQGKEDSIGHASQ